jgi:predicted nucleotidyltransferase
MTKQPVRAHNLTIPIGTQVVTRVVGRSADGAATYPIGAVAVVIATPHESAAGYQVRFPDGGEALFRRDDLAIRKHFQRQVFEQPSASELYDYVIYRCVVGSRAYGLDEDGSDTDRRGIYLPPADLHWSLGGVPEQLEDKANEECYWEIQKFLTLALKANPNVLECLYTPLVETATPLARELLDIRAIFLSRLIYQTYNGYVMSQFRRLEQDIRTSGAIKWKHAMHLVRLLLSGIMVLREGFVPVRVAEHRHQLLAIRRGELSWEEIDAWRLSLHKQFDAAFATTALPEEPDYKRGNAFLLKARRSMVEYQHEH